jgi:centrosomal protein CEP104
MLTVCSLCNQVVEIATLMHHYSDECDQRKKLKKCPRCKEPIPIAEYDTHVKPKTCVPPKNGEANRCLLCHKDLPPGAKSWKTHLINEGCPNSARGGH